MLRLVQRETTPWVVMLYAVYVHFQGVSLPPVSACLEHHVYDAARGNLMERFVQYVKIGPNASMTIFHAVGSVVGLSM